MIQKTLFLSHLLLHHEQQHADRIYLKQARNGQWHSLTWGEAVRQARQVAFFLIKLGLKKGSHISIFSKNCMEWVIADFGICLAGMVNVPLFSNQHDTSIEYVLKHAEVELVFVGKLDNPKRTRSYIPATLPTISFDYHSDLNTDHHWHDVLMAEPLMEVVHPVDDDLYTIIYSSGTSDTPKGAMYTHGAIKNYLSLFPADVRRVTTIDFLHMVSYLPLAHVYERSAILLGSLTVPADISFIDSLDTFVSNLQDIKPTMFIAVPRIWGVFKTKIEQKIHPVVLDILLKIPFLALYIKKQIRHELGLEACVSQVSGASHLPVSTLAYCDKIGLPIQEGYGQTENLAYATLSMLDERRPGYVGSPRWQVEIKQGTGGELLMKSPCLMKGYYKDPAATKAVLTEDGWLHTGDLVEIDALKRVKILGRLSDNFKNQKGEFISPNAIESEFQDKQLIDQLCVVGRELVSNVILLTLTKEARLLPKDEVTTCLQARLHATNLKLANYEKISHVLIVKGVWNTDNDLLTPTQKVKRRVVETVYQDFIQQAISRHQSVVWEGYYP